MGTSRFDTKKQEHKVNQDYVVANMNMEGMPWYRKERDYPEHITKGKNTSVTVDEVPLSKYETLHIIMGALKASLLIGVIFAGAFFLILLFVLYVWL